MLAYRYRDKTFQVVVNACTGEIQGERPWSWLKITAAIVSISRGIAVVGV